MRYAITLKQDGLENPEFTMTEDEVLEVWESGCFDSYNYIVMDSKGNKYIVADANWWTEDHKPGTELVEIGYNVH